MKTIFAVLVASAALLGMRGHAVAQPLPWCELPGDGNGAEFCNYYTFEQCREAARGDGTCNRNPRFDYYYARRGQRPPLNVDPRHYPVRRDCWGPFCW